MKRSPSYASGVLHRSNTQCVFIIGSTQEKVAHANVDAPPRPLHQDSALEAAGWVVRDSVARRSYSQAITTRITTTNKGGVVQPNGQGTLGGLCDQETPDSSCDGKDLSGPRASSL